MRSVLQRWLGGVAAIGAALVAVVAAASAISLFDVPFPGFGVYPNGRVAVSVGFDQGPTRGPGALDQIVSVNGREIQSGQEVFEIVSSEPLGTPYRYEMRHYENVLSGSSTPGELYQVTLRSKLLSPMEFLSAFGALFLVGVSFIAIGAVAFFLKPVRKTGALFAFCLAVGCTLLTTFDALSTHVFARSLHEISFWMIPATLFELSLWFPRESTNLKSRRWFLWLPYVALGAAPFVWQRFFGEGTNWFMPHLATLILIDGAAVYFFTRLLRQMRRSEHALVRQRAKVLLLGTIIGFIPSTVVFVGALSLDIDPPGGYLSAMPLILVPVTFAYAIFRHDLLDVDVVVRRGLFYVALLALAGALYFIILLVFSIGAQRNPLSRSPMFPLFFAALVVFITEPVRRRFWRYADQIYFRKGYDYRKTLRQASEEMAQVRTPDEVIAKLEGSVQEALEPELARMILLSDKEKQKALAVLCEQSETAVTAASLSEEELAPESQRAQALQELEALHARVALPLISEGQLLGILVLGQKKSGLLYTSEDLTLLRTLANQSAVALDNARKFKEIEDLNASLEKKVIERTKALEEAKNWLVQSEKMAALGRLVSGVAHELNNPSNVIGHASDAISDSAQRAFTVLQKVEGFSLSEEEKALLEAEKKKQKLSRAKEDLATMRDVLQSAARRISAIVLDLRIFSRGKVDEAREANIPEELERALRILTPKLNPGIEVSKNFAPEGSLLCYPDALGQVFLNLLSNAIDAVGDKGRIELSTRKKEDLFEITVKDDGPGISKEDAGRIFEPFFTTKDPGKGTGLGLWISYQIVERHGGTLEVESEPGKGALFRVRLPLSTKKPTQ